MFVEKEIHLTCNPLGGSVQHYHHFLLGYLVPLVSEWNSLVADPDVKRISVRSCAILDPILHALELPRLVILPKEAHAEIPLKDQGDAKENIEIRFVTLIGHDYPQSYNRQIFKNVKDQILFRFSELIVKHREEISNGFENAGPKILFINRSKPDGFYSSDASEAKTSGTQRRSIPNFHEAFSALVDRFGNVLATSLEGKSLLYQIALFSTADVIVCQHGAALANLIWAREGTRVVEIFPRDLGGDALRVDFFGRLASCLSIGYRRFWQPSSHGRVEIDKLSAMVAASLSDQLTGPDFSPSFGSTVPFDANSPYNFWLAEGWSASELWGTWSDGPLAILRLPLPSVPTQGVQLIATARAHLNSLIPSQQVHIVANGIMVGRWDFSLGESNSRRSVSIPTSILHRKIPIQLEFQITNPHSPAEAGVSRDRRKLGVGLVDLQLLPS
jgi:Glycosyltransferase 61